MKNKIVIILTFFFLANSSVFAQGRSQITVVGSSTVYPFTAAVAEQLGRQGKFKTPKVEATGTGGGIKLFCNGVGVIHPDVVNASRPMKKGEFDTCVQNGATQILEIKIGYDGLTIGESKAGKLSALTTKQVWLALAKQVPDKSGKLIANPYKTWNQIDPSLPTIKIEVLGPPPTSGTRDSFHELFMEAGCPFENKKQCHLMREDGAYIEAGENDNLIVQKLVANKNALGIFGFSFLEKNTDRIKALKINGIVPTYETISSAKYTASRPLFIYVKKQHVGVIHGLKEFAEEYVSNKAIGEEGYLSDLGLVSLDPSELTKVRTDVKVMKNFKP